MLPLREIEASIEAKIEGSVEVEAMFAAMLSKCFFEDMLPNSSLSYF